MNGSSLDLTSDEQVELRALMTRLNEHGGLTMSLDEMLHRWHAFAHAVDRGYDNSIYDYANELSVRDRLADLAAQASMDLRVKLERAFLPIDEQFRDATDDALRPIADRSGESRWWWRRVPKRRVGELHQDLEELGYV